MFSRPAVTAAALALASLTLAVPQTVRADAVTIMSVQSGHSIVLNTGGLTRVAVGDSRIAGVGPGTVRLSIGLEDLDDLIEDITQALTAADAAA